MMATSLPPASNFSLSITMPTVLPGCKELLSLGQLPRQTYFRNRRLSLVEDFSQSYTDLGRRCTRHKPYPTRDDFGGSRGQRSRKRKDTFDREEQRKAKLENDPWSDKTRLTPKSVFCLGCKRVIRLDRRNDYYPGLWLKHRELCQGIARAKREANERQKQKEKERISQSKPSIDDEEAAKILVEMMIKNRCFLNDSPRSPSLSL
uniref:Uncharacterized protein n=1 Tax=Moniliophthora roreri TaxID=221103 RepID=A0A0W0FQK3_MONRR